VLRDRLRRWGRGSCLVIAALGLAPAAAAADPDARPEVLSIRFDGAVAFGARTLESAIVTRQSRCRSVLARPACLLGFARDRFHLDEDVLRADVLRLRLFYYQHGYRNARVQATTEPAGADGVRIAFHIVEGAPVRVSSLSIDAPPTLPLAPLMARLPIASGEPFSTLAYEAARDTLALRLRNGGYPRAQVLASYLIPSDSPGIVHVAYELIPGSQYRFGPVRVRGNDRIAAGVVRRRLTFEPGDPYSQHELIESQRNLFGTRVFRHVDIRPELELAGDGVVPVTVHVSEGDLQSVRLGIGLNTADAVNAQGRWTSRNFLGGARRVEVSGRVANVFAEPLRAVPLFDTGRDVYGRIAGGLALDFTQPWLWGPRNTGGAGVFIDRRSLPEVFVRTSRGGYLSFGRALDARTTVSLAYRPELTRLQADGDLLFCVSFVACAYEERAVLEQPHWIAPVGFNLVRDRSNSILAPSAGHILRLEAEVADRLTGSDFRHVRILAEATHYRSVHPGVVLASRLRPGWAVSLGEPGDSGALGLHPQKRFFAGGSNSVRGFPQYQLGSKVLTVDAAQVLVRPVEEGGAGCSAETVNDGTCDASVLESHAFRARPGGGAVLLEGNVELRFPLWGDKLRAATFLDFGQVWPADRPVALADLAWSPGVGVRYFSPIGPIRVDVGYHASPGERLPVITTEICRSGDERCVAGENTNTLRQLDRDVFWTPRDSFLERFQIHLSIGQAF
jgi:outer membrane protein assembly factor BamA